MNFFKPAHPSPMEIQKNNKGFEMKLISKILLFFLPACLSWGHARLVTPTPRNNNAGIKTGPCGGLARSATPLQVQGGQTLTVMWEETVNHPGRFLFSLSLANDLDFQNNLLATIPDQQNSGTDLPHRYQTTLTIPNINCDSCTLQMIQSMEENPAAPTYYYSCADLVITQTGSQPSPSPMPMPSLDQSSFSSSLPSGSSKVSFGQGCGVVKSANDHDDLNFRIAVILLFLIPAFVWGSAHRHYRTITFRPRCKQSNLNKPRPVRFE